VKEPDLPRPFRVHGGMVGACLLGVGPVGLLGFALVKNAGEQLLGVPALLFGAGVAGLGAVAYSVARPACR